MKGIELSELTLDLGLWGSYTKGSYGTSCGSKQGSKGCAGYKVSNPGLKLVTE